MDSTTKALIELFLANNRRTDLDCVRDRDRGLGRGRGRSRGRGRGPFSPYQGMYPFMGNFVTPIMIPPVIVPSQFILPPPIYQQPTYQQPTYQQQTYQQPTYQQSMYRQPTKDPMPQQQESNQRDQCHQTETIDLNNSNEKELQTCAEN